MSGASLKETIVHELKEFLTVFLFMAPLFFAFSTYRILLLHQFGERSFAYWTAFVNALVLSKIVVVGEYLRLGKRHENRPLIYSTVYKSFVFTLLVAVFLVLEDAIKRILHGNGVAVAVAALSSRNIGEVLARSLVIFCAFLPFFALRETGRALGDDKLANLFLRSRAPAECGPPRR